MNDRARRDYNTDEPGNEGGVEQRRRPAKGPLIEWQVADERGEWPPAQPSVEAAPAPVYAWRRGWWIATTVALLVMLAVGGWLWHQAHTGLDRIEGELQETVDADEWQSANRIVEPNNSTSTSAPPQEGPAPDNLQSQLIKLGDDWAIVRVMLTKDGVAYRQTRLYRRGTRGWMQDAPRAASWGEPRTLESSHFVFHYYALDDDAVAAAADKLDALYPDLAASYSLDPAAEGKRQIWVSPEVSEPHPGPAAGDALQERSPALYLAPASLNEGELLAQAIFLDLLAFYKEGYIGEQFAKRMDDGQAMARVAGLLSALRLYQSWHSELPLGALYKPTIQWLYGDRQGVRRAPAVDAHLCPLHYLWQAAMAPIQIPLFCGEHTLEAYEVGRYFPAAAPRALAAIHLFKPAPADEPTFGMAETEWVGLATLFDYAAADYGQRSLAALIDNAASSTSWETLIPATFGVSAPEFEQGWQAYLRDHYGL